MPSGMTALYSLLLSIRESGFCLFLLQLRCHWDIPDAVGMDRSWKVYIHVLGPCLPRDTYLKTCVYMCTCTYIYVYEYELTGYLLIVFRPGHAICDVRCNCIAFVPPFLQMHMSLFNPHKKSHRKRTVYGSVKIFLIVACRCKTLSEQYSKWVLMEKLRPLTCQSQSDPAEYCGIQYLYGVDPKQIKYVIVK